MSAVEAIWSALQASPMEHAYEMEQERWHIELGWRAAADIAFPDGILRAMNVILLLRKADRLEALV